MKISSYLCICALGCAALPAQSTDGHSDARSPISQAVKNSLREDAVADNLPTSNDPPILNILTVIGNNVLGLPCLDCLLNLLVPSLGLPSPVSKALRGSHYQIDSYLIDNNYTGACTFTLAVTDVHNNVIVSVKQTLDETAGTDILLTTPITIPTDAGIGLGSVSNTAVCGSNTSQSKSPVLMTCVNNPPFCP
jgi:hypothetical protein